MLEYANGKGIGAFTYNLIHPKGLTISFYIIGVALAHTNLDRVFNYGLKHVDPFYRTHLGFIGKHAIK